MQNLLVDRLPSIADQTIAAVLAMLILAALGAIGRWFAGSLARIKSDWIRNAVIGNASVLPVLVLTGYAAYVGQTAMDLLMSLQMAAVYSAMALMPSRSLRIFLLAAPNVLFVASATALHWIGSPQGWTGALYLYNIYFTWSALAAMPVFFYIWVRSIRTTAQQDAPCASSSPPSPQRF